MKLETVYSQIAEQRKLLIKMLNAPNPVPPDQLSEVCVKLAVLNELLGSFIPALKSTQLETEKAYFDSAKALDSSDTGAASTARLSSKQERENYSRAEIQHTDLWKLISMAQSHIKALTEAGKSL